MSNWKENNEVKIFQEYLRIRTVHPNINYTACIEFLKRQAINLELPFEVIYPTLDTKPVLIIKWLGKKPKLPALMLNSHMDVVPVYADKWIYPPFDAEIDEDGRIYARGTQDMKSVGMQYLAAARKLKETGYQPMRSIYITYVPDEEVGKAGMVDFVKTNYFKKLNIGFAMDEGMPSPDDSFYVYPAERYNLNIYLKITGNAGSDSSLLQNSADDKLHYIINKIMAFRATEFKRLQKRKEFVIGNVTTINLTKIKGSEQMNAIPPVMEVRFDIRFSPDSNINVFKQQFQKWSEEAGGEIEINFESESTSDKTKRSKYRNPFWLAFQKTTNELGLTIHSCVLPVTTDSRFLRNIGIPAIGFSPMNNTPMLLHDNDEFIHAEVFLRGIDIYQKLIPALADAKTNHN